MSYALDSTQVNPRLRDTDYNHFVVFDAFNAIACHDFEVCLLAKPLKRFLKAFQQHISIVKSLALRVQSIYLQSTISKARWSCC